MLHNQVHDATPEVLVESIGFFENLTLTQKRQHICSLLIKDFSDFVSNLAPDG